MKVDLVGPKWRPCGRAKQIRRLPRCWRHGIPHRLSRLSIRSATGARSISVSVMRSWEQLSIMLVRDADHVRLEAAASSQPATPMSFREVPPPSGTWSLRGVASRPRQQPQRRHELKIARCSLPPSAWAFERIGVLKAIYPATWGSADRHRSPPETSLGRRA
jgi:hypothetical protein